MCRTMTILLALMSVSACSSQGAAWFTEQVFVNVAANTNTSRKYDEAELLPSPNQRLACQMDAQCKTPLTKSEFVSQEIDRFHARWGEDHKDGQGERAESFIPLDTYRQDYLQSQRVVLEQENERRSVVYRDVETQTQPGLSKFDDFQH